MKDNFSGQRFESVGERFLAIQAFLKGISADFLQIIFLECERRLQLDRGSGGEYVEHTVPNCVVPFPITCTGHESPGRYRAPWKKQIFVLHLPIDSMTHFAGPLLFGYVRSRAEGKTTGRPNRRWVHLKFVDHPRQDGQEQGREFKEGEKSVVCEMPWTGCRT
jgi:hypothetical protein